MAKLEGIIYKAFGNYIVLRGFAPIGEIAKISKKPESYQRDSVEQHKVEIVKYLTDLKSYFPEVTLACRTSDYAGLITSIGTDTDVSNTDSQFVKGLRVLSEYLPTGRDRARHAYLELRNPNEDEKLTRVDGNHRLEPFSSDINWWYQFLDIPVDVLNESDEEKKDAWLQHQAKVYRAEIEGKIIPFTVVISERDNAENFEAKIFHDINFKQLPLRQEASLKIISDLDVFDDKEKLGSEYPLALKIIDITKTGAFNGIYWLTAKQNVNETYYRTACLRIVQLLISRKVTIQNKLEKAEKQKKQIEIEFKQFKINIQNLQVNIENKKKEIELLKDENQEVSEQTLKYKNLNKELRNLTEELNSNVRQQDYDSKLIDSFNNKIESLEKYLFHCEDVDSIVKAIHSLRNIYELFANDSFGNISLLVALVYYSLLDKTQLNTFANWVIKNGINKINEPDDLSKDGSENFIRMFEQIYDSKKNEIFISMQFGDSQSELIYEKVVRTIEQFNKKYSGVHLHATPIRIDRAVTPSAFSIQDGILDAIKSCSLIIADLSSANINVYHEIGYAMGFAQSNGLYPNIILLYKEDSEHNRDRIDINKYIGFNLRSLSQLRFKSYDELLSGLLERLEKHFEV